MDHATMLSIKEFSDFTGLPESTLRYYDKIGLLSPELRGENRYRYYTPMQAFTVEYLKVLIKVGVPLSIIKDMHKNRTPHSVLALLTKQEQKLDAQLHELQTAFSILHTYRNTIQAGLLAQEDDISVRTLDETQVTLGPLTDFSKTDTFYIPFMEFYNTAHENKIDIHYPIGGYYETMDVFLRTPAQPTRFFSLDPRGNSKRKTGQYLVAFNKGYYGDFGDLPQKMVAYAQAKGLSFSGPLYITYLLDEISVADYKHYLSQVAVGVSKRR
jgi:DNA-binding transcriptional MerR regulator